MRRLCPLLLALASLTAAEPPADQHAWEEFRLKDGRVVQGYYSDPASAIMVQIGSMTAEIKVRAGDIVSRTPMAAPPVPPPRRERPAVDPVVAQQRAAAAAEEQLANDRASLEEAIPRYEKLVAKAEEDLEKAKERLEDLTTAISERESALADAERNNIVDEQFGGYQWNEATQQWVLLNKRNYDVRRRLTESKNAIVMAKRRTGLLKGEVDQAERKVKTLTTSLENMRARYEKLPPVVQPKPADPGTLLGE